MFNVKLNRVKFDANERSYTLQGLLKDEPNQKKLYPYRYIDNHCRELFITQHVAVCGLVKFWRLCVKTRQVMHTIYSWWITASKRGKSAKLAVVLCCSQLSRAASRVMYFCHFFGDALLPLSASVLLYRGPKLQGLFKHNNECMREPKTKLPILFTLQVQ